MNLLKFCDVRKKRFEPVYVWLQSYSVTLRREFENNNINTHFLTAATHSQRSMRGYGNSETAFPIQWSHCLSLKKHIINLLTALGELAVHGSRGVVTTVLYRIKTKLSLNKSRNFCVVRTGRWYLYACLYQLLPPTAHSKPAAPSSWGEPAGAVQHAASHCSSLPQKAGSEWELAGPPKEPYFVLHHAVSYSFPVCMLWIHKTIY